jgi:tetratricopeptide (TPR) repeat protein
MVGISYHSMGQFQRSIPFLEQAHRLARQEEAPLPERLEAANSLAAAYRSARRIKEAIALWEELLATSLAAPEQVSEDLILTAKSNLAGAYRVEGRYREALRLFGEVFQQLGKQPSAPPRLALSTMMNLGATYLALKQVEPAIRMQKQGMELAQKLFGEEDIYTLSFVGPLAEALQQANQTNEAQALLERTLPRASKRLGDSHPITVQLLDKLAGIYRTRRQPEKALVLLERIQAAQGIDLTADSLGNPLNDLGEDRETSMHRRAAHLNILGLLYSESNRFPEAIATQREAIALEQRTERPNPDLLFIYRDNLGYAYFLAQQWENAIDILAALRYDRMQLRGSEHPGLVLTLGNLTASYRRVGQLRRAADTALQAYQLRKKVFGANQRETILYLGVCAELLRDSRDGERLVAIAPEIVAEYRRRYASNLPELAGRMSSLGYDLLRCGRGAEAEVLFRESLAFRKKNQPNDWRTFSTESMLGEALLLQKKTDQAEPLLRSGWEGMVQRRASIPATAAVDRLTEGADRLVRLYQSLGKTEEVQRWRAEWQQWGRVLPLPEEIP